MASRNVILPLGPSAEYVLGENTPATRQRMRRWVDAGVLRPIRIGTRRDRWFATDELDRFMAGDDGSRGGGDAPAA